MKTTIEIDDSLLEKALRLSGLRTKRAVVEEGLRLLVQLKSQEPIRRLRGQLRWEGALDDMRRD